jgi:hypothetical protein
VVQQEGLCIIQRSSLDTVIEEMLGLFDTVIEEMSGLSDPVIEEMIGFF